MGKVTGLEEIKITALKPYEKNAKKHSKEQIKKLCESIREFGFISPCLIDRDMNIIAGHGRVMAEKELGMDTVPCVWAEGLTEAQRRAYILADNKLTELGDWDMDLVNEELADLKDLGVDISLTGFEMDLKFDDTEESDGDYMPEDDGTPKRCQLGQEAELLTGPEE